MSKYVEREDRIEVPKNTGIQGFLKTLDTLLRLPRLQTITIDSRGFVVYKRFVSDDEYNPIGVDYAELQPTSVMRYGTIEEVRVGGMPYLQLARVLEQVAVEQLEAVAWVVGKGSNLVEWLARSTLAVRRERLLGYPVVEDAQMNTTSLVLCAAYARGAAIIDCQRFFKLDMVLPRTAPEVEIIP